ncbi:MAG: ATP-binding cassette domain-containing protein, partial [Brachymonas sp.]|nr:ATP-binding cassette domain-containing protein [Brachymonas sp.]
ASAQAREELLRYGLPEVAHQRYPHQLSGGMARRVLTAIATVSHADLLIADEPTSGLDPEVCQMALQHMRSLADAGKGVLVITHDLDAVRHFADRIVVMQAGRTVEEVDAATFASGRAQHPFTRALYHALPQNGFHAHVETETSEAAHA